MKYLKGLLTLAICSTAIIGDYIVFKSKYSQSQVFRAISDTIVHGSIGFFSALLFFSQEMNVTSHASLYNILFCTVMSSLIDIDHAIIARSFHLKDITNLKHRGFLHCSSLWMLITAAFLAYSYIVKKLNLFILTWMLIIAYTSHHIRDGNRRGIWLYPFGHTPAIPRYTYICLLAILPHIYSFMYRYTAPSLYNHTVINYDYNIVV